MESLNCGFAGNPDLYGLGIRIGIYLQVMSTIITDHCLPAEAANTAAANLIFVSALIAALIRSISDLSKFAVVEGFVMLQLILVFFLALSGGTRFMITEAIADGLGAGILRVVRNQTLQEMNAELELKDDEFFGIYLSRYGRAYFNTSPLRQTIRKTLAVAAFTLNLWFWISGVHQLRREAASCPTYIFVFSRNTVDEPVRSMFIVIAILNFLPMLATSIFFWRFSHASIKGRFLAALDPRPISEHTWENDSKRPARYGLPKLV